MAVDKSFLTGSTTMLILKLLDEGDMYGYQMIDELGKKSNNVFELKAGTLPADPYPQGYGSVLTRPLIVEGRRYYCITKTGHRHLQDKKRNGRLYRCGKQYFGV